MTVIKVTFNCSNTMQSFKVKATNPIFEIKSVRKYSPLNIIWYKPYSMLHMIWYIMLTWHDWRKHFVSQLLRLILKTAFQQNLPACFPTKTFWQNLLVLFNRSSDNDFVFAHKQVWLFFNYEFQDWIVVDSRIVTLCNLKSSCSSC